MPWFDKAKAVLWTWYAGMEMGNAFANILFGDKNPSGKLPMTFPIKYEDTPVYRYGEYKDAECEYKDDIFVGYRGYEKDNIKPLLPFGYGLSYTTFDYLNLSVNGNIVKCDIQNVGNRVGKEIVQLYIGVENTDILHPVKELKDFCKVELNPQETKTVEFEITEDMLTYYDEEICNWEKYKGDYRVYIGSSVSDIRLHAALENEIH